MTYIERKYSTTDLECLAVVSALRTLRPYIERTKFLFRTDHDALRYVKSLTETLERLTRWRLQLEEYDFPIHCSPGRVHKVLDASLALFL